MEHTTQSLETVTFKRSHFYSVLVVVAFFAGILIGYIAWGRGSSAANNQPVAAGAPTQQAFRRYEIPTEGFPSTGPKDAAITIVEFSDFQCPYCQKWHDQVYEPLMDSFPGQIRFVYRNFPLTQLHPQAMSAAEASLCAGEQDAYWEYHAKLFENSASLSDELYTSLASDLGLNIANFETCLSTHKYLSEVEADMEFAINLGIQSTPTFFINGIPFVGAQPLSNFQQLVENELAGKYPQ